MIRKATLRDRSRVIELWSAFLEEQVQIDSGISPSEDAAERLRVDFPVWLADSTYVVAVAEADGQVVGFVTGYLWSMPPVFKEVREVFVEYLFIHPAWRRRGIGRDLIGYVRAWGEERHASRLRAGVLSSNKDAVSFFSAAGATEFVTELVIEIDGKAGPPQKKPLGFGGNT